VVGTVGKARSHDAGRVGNDSKVSTPDIVEKILVSVNSYYSQFETTAEPAKMQPNPVKYSLRIRSKLLLKKRSKQPDAGR